MLDQFPNSHTIIFSEFHTGFFELVMIPLLEAYGVGKNIHLAVLTGADSMQTSFLSLMLSEKLQRNLKLSLIKEKITGQEVRVIALFSNKVRNGV